MNEETLNAVLGDLPLGGIRFFPRTGSTNEDALIWAQAEAPDMSLVVAKQQTRGRGRGGSSWLTLAEGALAFSLVLRPCQKEVFHFTRFTGLGALAAAGMLERLDLEPAIKWPNDLLLNRRKVAGVLVESLWTGTRLDAVILGVGLNVGRGSLPAAQVLAFPATCIEEATGCSLEREALLRGFLIAMLEWRPKMGSAAFLQAWEQRLAFRKEDVILQGVGNGDVTAVISGLEQDGSLRLIARDGTRILLPDGTVHLRPVL